MELKGKCALVCGASQGIGAGCATELAQKGAKVILLARSKPRLEQVKEGLRNPYDHVVLPRDLLDYEGLKKDLEDLQKTLGPIHICVMNTKGPKSGPVLDAEESEFQQALDQHILTNVRLVKSLYPGMKQAGYGRFINILSTSVRVPIPNLGVSNTIRAAVASWAKTLSSEIAPFGITVNNILPGYTKTPRLMELLEETAKKKQIPIETVEKQWLTAIPLGRFAEPNEVGAVAAFLASPAASYITGTSIPVDGGRTVSI